MKILNVRNSRDFFGIVLSPFSLSPPLGHVRQSGLYAFLDVTLVRAPDNPEQPVLAPRSAPRVGAQPVLDAVLDAPAQHLDGVTAFHLAPGVPVHPCGQRKFEGASPENELK